MYSFNVDGHIGTGRTQSQAEIAAGYAMLNGLDKADIDDAIPGWDEAVKAQFAPRRKSNHSTPPMKSAQNFRVMLNILSGEGKGTGTLTTLKAFPREKECVIADDDKGKGQVYSVYSVTHLEIGALGESVRCDAILDVNHVRSYQSYREALGRQAKKVKFG